MSKSFKDSNGKSYSCTVLVGKSNYNVWAFTMKEHLKTAHLEKFISDPKLEPENSDETEQAQAAKSMVLSTIAPDEITKIIHCSTVGQIWAHFELAYGKKTSNEKLELINEMNTFRCSSPKEVPDVVNRAMTIKGRLGSLGLKLDDVMLIDAITRALPPEPFETFLANWTMLDVELQTLSRFLSKLLDRSKSLAEDKPEHEVFVANHTNSNGYRRFSRGKYHPVDAQQRPTRAPSSDAHQPNNRDHQQTFVHNANQPRSQLHAQINHRMSSNNQIVCHYCHNIGHIKSECHKLQRHQAFLNAQTSRSAHVSNSQWTGQSNQIANQASAESATSIDSSATEISFIAIDRQNQLMSTEWIVDSGCSSHMTSNMSWIEDFNPFSNPTNVRIGDNRIILAYGSGKVRTSFGSLADVHYVPEIGSNLLSVSAASEKGLKFVFDHVGLVILHKGQELFRAPRRGGTYVADLYLKSQEKRALYAVSPEIWHRRLAHIPMPLVMRMIKGDYGLRVDHVDRDPCIECKLNKCTRASHPPRSTPKATRPGESLHFDIIGPIKPPGLGNERFILVGVDEYSGFRFSACLIAKSAAPETIKLIVNLMESQTGNSLLRITTDQAVEFLSDRLVSFLQSKGVDHILSAHYVPQQNGRAEKENCSLLNQSRTILNAGRLDQILWPYAVRTATYVHNRCISPTHSTSPFETWFGRKPNVNNLRVFGQHAIVLKAERYRGKFDEKGERMYFIGYTDNSQTYLFFDPTSKRVIMSCDATFVNSFGPITKPEPFVITNAPTTVLVPISTSTQANAPSVIESADQSAKEDELAHDLEPLADKNPQRDTQVCQVGKESSSNPDTKDASFEMGGSESFASAATSSEYSIPMPSNDEDKTLSPPNITSTPVHVNPANTHRQLRNITPRDYKALARGSWKLDKLANIATVDVDEVPTNYQAIRTRPDAQQWFDAVENEMNSMRQNNVYELVPEPNANVIGCRWVFTLKSMADGSIKPKARLVAQGFTQRPGVDYTATFSPVVQMDNVRFLFAIAAARNLIITQIDIKTAFLYGDLAEQIFMRQPEGCNDGTNKVWQLKRSIYGLKQAPRCWNSKFSTCIRTIGFIPTPDDCIFILPKSFVIIAIYVDDALIMSRKPNDAHEVITLLKREFDIHIFESKKFLGFQYDFNANGNLVLHQQEYISNLLEKYHFEDANTRATPMLANSKADEAPLLENNTLFREINGALQYAASITRPDIAYTVNYLGRKVLNPTTAHWQTIKHCLRYLRGSLNLGLEYHSNSTTQLTAYSDADFAGDGNLYRSTTGMAVFYGSSLIAWQSKLQKTTVTSTAESEYLAASSTIKRVLCIKDLGMSLKFIDDRPVPIFCDNSAAVQIASDQASTQRTRHMGAQLYFAREQHKKGKISMQFLPGDQQVADIFTKPLQVLKFERNRALLMAPVLAILCLTCLVQGSYGNPTAHLSMMNPTTSTNISAPTPNHAAHQLSTNLITLVRTKFFVESGRVIQVINIPRQDYCVRWSNELMRHPVSSPRYFMIEKLFKHCRSYYDSKMSPILAKLEAISRLSSNSRPRSPRDTKLSGQNLFLPFKCKRPIEQPTLGKTALLTLSLVGWAMYQYIEPNSSHNGAINNRECINQLESMIISNKKHVENIRVSNKLQLENINLTVSGLNGTMNKLDNVISTVPAILHEASAINSEILREADMLGDLEISFRHGYVNLDAITKLSHHKFETFKGLRNKDVKFESLIMTNRFLSIKLIRPNIDFNVTIFKLISFIDYSKIDQGHYYSYQGHQYLLWNATNNCSHLIEDPKEISIRSYCLIENQTANYYESKLWIEHDASQTNQSFEPIIHEVDSAWMIQCYKQNLTFNGLKTQCSSNPLILPVNQSFCINDSDCYQNEEETISLFERNENDLIFHQNSLTDPWRTQLERVSENQRRQQVLERESKELDRKFPILVPETLSDHPIEFSVGIASLILIVCALLIYCLRPDPIIKAMQLQILSNVHNKGISKSVPDLRSSTSVPNINIFQCHTIGRPQRLVTFDHNQANLYPTLEDCKRNDWRAPTPFQEPSAPFSEGSSDSWATHEERFLPQTPVQPHRFKPSDRFQSTLSVPSLFH